MKAAKKDNEDEYRNIFDEFNSVRNNNSLAHDNQLLNPDEAKYVFDNITLLLRFINKIESAK